MKSHIPSVTCPKGGAATMKGMNAIDAAREARSRNLARLRTMTIGTAAVSVAAAGGFGWLAALTYHGTTPTVTTALAAVNGASATPGAAAAPAATATATATATPAPSSAAATAAPSVVSGSGTAHAVSGGS
ncbi:MAG TPA: hypothetical protein VIH37_05980 [Candidatus Limnocylindrales bacterium]